MAKKKASDAGKRAKRDSEARKFLGMKRTDSTLK